MRTLAIIAALQLASCDRPHAAKKTVNSLEDVLKKRDLYVELAQDLQDEYGWLPEKCDGLLFNSLAAYSGFPVDPMKAEKTPGEWHRHPSFSCFPDESPSTISKDMFRGLLLYLNKLGDADALARLEAYGEDHNWFMGEGKDEEAVYGRTLWTPTLILQLKGMIAKLALLKISLGVEEFVILQDDFGAHLDALRILLNAKIKDGLTDYEKNVLKEYAMRDPRNALFQALYHKFTDGVQHAAVDILMDENLFPADHLPTTDNYCAHYLWERDQHAELWEPCEGGKTHPGIDFMFVAKLLEE